MYAPICLFTFNRLNETQQTVKALQENYLATESELFIFSDGPKNQQTEANVTAVRDYIKSISGFKLIQIIESKENKGLADSIISGVTFIFEKYEKVIVLEDDLIASPNFLNFMNQALDFYQPDINIQSISGFSLSLKNKINEVYFQTRPGSWGWATWKNRWKLEIFNKEKIKAELISDPDTLNKFRIKCGADMSEMLLDSIHNRNDSWYVRWAFHHFLNNHYSVFPAYSYIQNIGFGNEGIHCQGINSYISEPIDEQKVTTRFPDFQIPNKKLSREFLCYFSIQHKILFRIKLLRTNAGRRQILEEIITKLGIQ